MKLGFLVQTLGTSQLGTYLILEVNKLIQQYPHIDTMVFYEEYDKIPIQPRFTLMQSYHVQSFTGPVISTCLQTTRLLKHLHQVTHKYFYVWNLEWVIADFPFNVLSDLYQDDDIKLIARSVYHADIITKLWKQPTIILEDFNYETLNQIASNSV